jgi:hypothetical protein
VFNFFNDNLELTKMLKPKNLGDDLPGFEAPADEETPQAEAQSTKKKKKGSGGFQAMGFNFPVLKGITKRGYKQPTPIQRKVCNVYSYCLHVYL